MPVSERSRDIVAPLVRPYNDRDWAGVQRLELIAVRKSLCVQILRKRKAPLYKLASDFWAYGRASAQWGAHLRISSESENKGARVWPQA